MTSTDQGVWSSIFIGIGLVIIWSKPAEYPSRFFLFGCAAIVVGLGFGIGAWFGWRRGR